MAVSMQGQNKVGKNRVCSCCSNFQKKKATRYARRVSKQRFKSEIRKQTNEY